MDNNCTNNIFLITNGLEKFTGYFKRETKPYNFCDTALENLVEAVKRRQKLSQFTNKDIFVSENNLIIINREFYNRNLKNINENIFLADFNNNPPHFLYINQNPDPDLEKRNLEFDEDDFFYVLSETEQDTGELLLNQFNMNLIFKCIANRKRVHNYIVTSFQTIVESRIIARQKIQIEKLYSELEAISKIDGLTNVLSRKAFFDAMELERLRTKRDYRRLKDCNEKPRNNRKPIDELSEHYGHFSCMMIDIDNFKKINDTYGHLIGDDVLKKLGELLNSDTLFRENDIIGRYGGEEFVVILPETKAEYARYPANRLINAINNIEFSSNKGIFHVTISVGISEFNPMRDDSCDIVIQRADKALYAAKSRGKNTVVLYDEMEDDLIKEE